MIGPDQLVERCVLRMLPSLVDAFRVVVLNGPRQSGKSTVLRELHARQGGELHNLDVEAVRQAVTADPDAFVRRDGPYVFIDEVQRGGDALVRAIKTRVDERANTTKYVLTGSTNFLTIPSLSESLAGRADFVEMWPFAQGEVLGRCETFVDLLVGDQLSAVTPTPLMREDYFELVCAGGYPEAVRLESRLRSRWFRSYVRTVTQRDIADFADVRQTTDLLRLLRYLAGKTAQELVKTRLAADVGIERHTVTRYLSLLETVFLVRELPAWSRNPLGKVTRTSKVHVTDTGLIATLTGSTAAVLAKPIAPMRGRIIESFVHNELLRQLAWSKHELALSHWRHRDGAEVDLVCESDDGRVFGIEVKASTTVTQNDFRWLRRLAARLGDEFVQGIVLYLGRDVLSFGRAMTAMPLSSLWAGGGQAT